jgi:hypothetical protein
LNPQAVYVGAPKDRKNMIGYCIRNFFRILAGQLYATPAWKMWVHYVKMRHTIRGSEIDKGINRLITFFGTLLRH